jgi:general secretion pathway protein E
LVFSTLHTNDAPSAFTRLIDMGIEPFLVASSVEAVMAQRLVRTICSHCKTEQKVDADYLRRIGFPELDIATAKIWRGAGCENCRQQGYQGRKGIYELLLVSENIRPLIMNRSSSTAIAQRAMDAGMRTLRTDGWNKVKAGETTIEEVLRVTQMEEHLDSLAGGEDKTQFISRT